MLSPLPLHFEFRALNLVLSISLFHRVMRLSQSTCQAITSSVAKIAPEAACYLFGSRTDDSLKGGDIDLLLITSKKLSLRMLSKLRRSILNQIGEQKIDLVNFSQDSTHPFKKIALETAIKL